MLEEIGSDDVNSTSSDIYNYIDPEIATIHTLSLTSHLWDLYKTKSGANVTVTCVDQCFSLHYPVLSHGSTYFRKELDDNKRDIELNFTPDIDPEIFEIIVECLYTGTMKNVDDNNVTGILRAGYQLDIANVIQVCSKFMIDSLDPDNCLKYWLAAKSCECEKAAKDAYGMIGRHLQNISKRLEFGQLQPNMLIQLLSDNSLQISSEEVVYEAAINWIKFDEETRKSQLHLVLGAVRLPLLSQDYLVNVVGNEALIENDPFAMIKYSEALKCKLNAGARANIPYGSRHSLKNAVIGSIERFVNRMKNKDQYYEDEITRDMTDLSIEESNKDLSEDGSELERALDPSKPSGSDSVSGSFLSFGGPLEFVPEEDNESLSTMGDKYSI